MALKSKEWFYKQCLLECDQNGPLQDLSWNILLKGIAQVHSTRGHATQAIGGVQRFFQAFPHHRPAIQAQSPIQPFDIASHPVILSDWIQWLTAWRARPSDSLFGYRPHVLRNILPPNLGGSRQGGGGGGDELKIVFRLMPDFWGRR